MTDPLEEAHRIIKDLQDEVKKLALENADLKRELEADKRLSAALEKASNLIENLEKEFASSK